jgi:hypothetical protein
MDNTLLKFKLNNPKNLSAIPENTADMPHTPRGFQSYDNEQASGQYIRKNRKNIILNPSPRNQLNYPMDNKFCGVTAPYYKQVLGNANFVRGNQFGVAYPYTPETRSQEFVLNNSNDDQYPLDSNNNNNIVMRKRSPFYPYPNFNYTKDNRYQTYPHIKKYKEGQPIYNYKYGRSEGIPEGRYNPFLVENFSSGYNNIFRSKNTCYLGYVLIIGIILLYFFRR